MKTLPSFRPMAALFAWLSLAAPGLAQPVNSGSPSAPWINGPAPIALRDQIDFALPAGFVFLAERETRTVLQRLGIPRVEGEIGLVAPDSREWFVLVKVLDTGHVPDGGGTSLDAEAILARLRQLENQANLARQKVGAPPVELIGWEAPPSYRQRENRLEWAVRARTPSAEIVNRVATVLGRKSAAQFCLVDSSLRPEPGATLARLAGSVRFRPGLRYEDHDNRDSEASSGLPGFIVGFPPARIDAANPAVSTRAPRSARIASPKPWIIAFAVIGIVATFFAGLLAFRKVNESLRRSRRSRRSLPRRADFSRTKPADARKGRFFDPHRYYLHLTRDVYRDTL